MPIFKDILTNIFKGGEGKIIDSIKDVVDDYVYTKEEKAQAEAEHEKWAAENEYRNKTLDYEMYQKSLDSLISFEKLDVENLNNSREREVKIVESNPDKVQWITVNINSILAIGTFLGAFLLYYIVFFKSKSIGADHKEMMMYVLGAVTTQITSIYSYYFGSSRSSASKNTVIENMSKGKNNTLA